MIFLCAAFEASDLAYDANETKNLTMFVRLIGQKISNRSKPA
jgi:hypothetical protein